MLIVAYLAYLRPGILIDIFQLIELQYHGKNGKAHNNSDHVRYIRLQPLKFFQLSVFTYLTDFGVNFIVKLCIK